jgi:hypothetical protein
MHRRIKDDGAAIIQQGSGGVDGKKRSGLIDVNDMAASWQRRWASSQDAGVGEDDVELPELLRMRFDGERGG